MWTALLELKRDSFWRKPWLLWDWRFRLLRARFKTFRYLLLDLWGLRDRRHKLDQFL